MSTLKNPWESWLDSYRKPGHFQPPQLFAPPPQTPDLQGAAKQDADANRINQENEFGSTVTYDPVTGAQKQSFGGPLAGHAQGLMGQVAGQGAFDWSKFGALPTGDEARQQAISSAWGHSTSRLDPMWNQREDRSRTQLLNQGLDEGSEAYKTASENMGRDRNDAYAAALAGAIGQGTAAGDSVFRNSLAGRQQMVGEALTDRNMPMDELLKMRGLTGQKDYAKDNGALTAAIAQGGFDQRRWESLNQQQKDLIDGIFDAIGSVASVARGGG